MAGRGADGARPVVIVRGHTAEATAPRPDGAPAERAVDYVLLRDELDARILDLADVEASRLARLVRRVAGTYAALSVTAFRQRATATAFISNSENEAILLGLLLKATRGRTPVVAVGQYPAKRQKWAAWRLARVHTHIHRLMPLGTVQAERLAALGLPAEKVEVLPYGIDTDYWHPDRATVRDGGRPYVMAAGLQHRDYATLVRATEGLGVDLLIAAASPWSKSANQMGDQPQPEWVRVESPSLTELRDAYAGALAVVAPVVETDFPAGTTSILEAMAMGKPVVVARSEGAGDYVSDRRRLLRRGPLRATSAGYAARFGSPASQGQTGLYFPVGDADELRNVLRWVIDHPAEAATIGARGRVVVEDVYRVQDYVSRIAAAVRSGIAQDAAETPHAAR